MPDPKLPPVDDSHPGEEHPEGPKPAKEGSDG